MSLLPPPQQLSVTTGTFVRAVIVIIGALALFLVRDVVLILLTSVVIASAIEPAIAGLVRWRFPRVLAVLAVYLLVVAVLFTISIIFIPSLLSEISRLSVVLPQYLQNISFSSFLPDNITQAGGAIFNNFSITDGIDQFRVALAGLSHGFLQTVATIFGGALSAVLILVISFYLAVEERGVENFLRVIVPFERERYVVDLWRRSQLKIGRWLQGQLLLGVVIGVLVFLGLSVLNVPYAISLAAIAAILEIIPVFGPILAAVPAALVAFGISPGLGLMVIGLYVIVQQFENHLITPLVITKIVGIPPIMVIIALLIGAKLGGFLGILLSVPLTTILVEIIADMEKSKIARGLPPTL